MRFTLRSFWYSRRLRMFAVGVTALVLGCVGVAAAQTLETGPIKVTDSGSITPSGYALKGVTGTANNAGLFGYGNVSSSALNIDGVVGYVQTQQSVGVVGWAQSTGTSAYGIYGYSATGPGVYGYNNNGAAASIYGYNTSNGGTALYGYSTGGNGVLGSSTTTNGVVGMTNTSGSGYAGVMGSDTSSGTSNVGVNGTSTNGIGVVGYGPSGIGGVTTTNGDGVFGLGVDGVYGMSSSTLTNAAGVLGIDSVATGVIGSGVIGVYGQTGTEGIGVYGEATDPAGYGVEGYTPGGTGVAGFGEAPGIGGLFISVQNPSTLAYGTAVQVQGGAGLVEALLGAPTGEAGIFYGTSGVTAHPALIAQQAHAGTDYFATVNAIATSPPVENFIIQATTANFSGSAIATYGNDVQVSGDLYVQGGVYQLCSSSSGAFPVTAPAAHCSEDSGLVPATDLTSTLRTRSQAKQVRSYAAHQTIPTVEDFGEARLVNGEASVPLEHTFASTIDPSREYLVFITPLGDCRGLYVAARSPNGFVVRELMNGRANVEFQYRIVAHPFGDNAPRLPSTVVARGAPGAIATVPVLKVAPHAFRLRPALHIPPPPAPFNGRPLRLPKTGALPVRPPLPHVNLH